MLEVGQVVIYHRDVCTVKAIVKNFREGQDFYKLAPYYDQSLTIHVPVEGSNEQFRSLLVEAEVEALINQIPHVACADTDDRKLETVYKELYNSEKHEDLIRIIKTSYLRSEEKLAKGQSRGEKDKMYFRKAENALYNELAVVLNKSVKDTREYVVERVAALAQ